MFLTSCGLAWLRAHKFDSTKARGISLRAFGFQTPARTSFSLTPLADTVLSAIIRSITSRSTRTIIAALLSREYARLRRHYSAGRGV